MHEIFNYFKTPSARSTPPFLIPPLSPPTPLSLGLPGQHAQLFPIFLILAHKNCDRFEFIEPLMIKF